MTISDTLDIQSYLDVLHGAIPADSFQTHSFLLMSDINIEQAHYNVSESITRQRASKQYDQKQQESFDMLNQKVLKFEGGIQEYLADDNTFNKRLTILVNCAMVFHGFYYDNETLDAWTNRWTNCSRCWQNNDDFNLFCICVAVLYMNECRQWKYSTCSLSSKNVVLRKGNHLYIFFYVWFHSTRMHMYTFGCACK